MTTSLVKSMPSGSGICTPFFVLSAERESWDEAELCYAPAYTPSCVGAVMPTVNNGHDGQLQQGLQWGLQ